MKYILVGFGALVASLQILNPVLAQDVKNWKIAIVRMNDALNTSAEGKKSKSLLEAAGQKIESNLKPKEEKIMQMKKDLENNLLNEDARKKKMADFDAAQREYFAARQQQEQQLKNNEQKYTETIFKSLKDVVQTIAKKEGYDMVIEYSLSTAILYSKFNYTDITDEVIKEFDALKSGK